MKMKTNNQFNKSNGFTLVELLVVIAIIAILMAILLPALELAREKARQARCMSNLKQAGIGLQLYFNEWNYYPYWAWLPGGDHENPWQENLLGDKKYGDYKKIGFKRCQVFVDSRDVFMCPSDKPHPDRCNKGRQDRWGHIFEFSYGLSMHVGSSPDAPLTYKPYFAKDASSQVVTSDGSWSWMVNFSGDYLEGATWDTPSWYSNTVAYRHVRYTTGNFLRNDCSVASYKWQRAKLPDTKEIYFVTSGEDHYIPPGWRP